MCYIGHPWQRTVTLLVFYLFFSHGKLFLGLFLNSENSFSVGLACHRQCRLTPSSDWVSGAACPVAHECAYKMPVLTGLKSLSLSSPADATLVRSRVCLHPDLPHRPNSRRCTLELRSPSPLVLSLHALCRSRRAVPPKPSVVCLGSTTGSELPKPSLEPAPRQLSVVSPSTSLPRQ
jgi:hypothetical protein